MIPAVQRLSKKLADKLECQDYYEAHQLYRTIYFRLQREINFTTLTYLDEGSPRDTWTNLLQNRVEFIEKNPAYSFLLDFLANGVASLLKAKELISGMDLLKLYRVQFSRIVFLNECKAGSESVAFSAPEIITSRNVYYKFLQQWFDRMMDLSQLYADTGLEMLQNKSAASKGFQENDFISERDIMIFNNLNYSKSLRVVEGEDILIRNMYIFNLGQPEMHLRHGKMLMRFQELSKARHSFIYSQDAFELAKFLYFYQRAECNPSEYELVLVKTILKLFNTQLLINAKPGMYRGQRGEKFKKLRIVNMTDETMAKVKVGALNQAKEVFYYYLAITKFFLLKDPSGCNTTGHFKQMLLLKYFNFWLILMEECLRQEDIVPTESSNHFNTILLRQMRKQFRFNEESCFASEKETEKFLNFFGNRKHYAESLANAVTGDGKLYLLKLLYELRTNLYKPTLSYYRKVDRELDVDLMDRIFFAYFNDAVPQSFPDIRDEVDTPGFFEPAENRQAAQAPPNIFNMLLGGMAGGSQGGGSAEPNFMSFLNDFMQ